MVKIVIRKFQAKGHTRRSIRKTRVRDASGQIAGYFTIDARSPTFEDDLTQIYKSNVAKARSENKKLFGKPDPAGRFIDRVK